MAVLLSAGCNFQGTGTKHVIALKVCEIIVQHFFKKMYRKRKDEFKWKNQRISIQHISSMVKEL